MKTPLYLLLTTLALSACCRPKNLGEVRFTLPELSVVPYNGDEQLEFMDDSAHTISYNRGYR
jgi:hypothetical protein